MNVMVTDELPADLEVMRLKGLLNALKKENDELREAVIFWRSASSYLELTAKLKSLRFLGWMFRPTTRQWLKERHVI